MAGLDGRGRVALALALLFRISVLTVLLTLLGIMEGVPVVHAYVPAMPTNQTDIIQGAINQSDSSMLQLQWYPNASFAETVSYQLVGEDTSGISKGALVHFAESNITLGFDTRTPDDDTDPEDQPTPHVPDFTSTPWIAFIACDFNSTNATQEVDVFTLAKNRGAVAALLYSKWSDACLINPEYADPARFNQVFDIFSTKSLITARTIENAFTNVNQTLYGNFNASMLNNTVNIINTTFANGQVPSPSFLFATLTAANASIPGGNNGDGGAPASSTGGGSKNTDLAMIVLYVITGAVSVLFCIVILSGAIRAIRHPERYGPRPADPTMGGEYGAGQSRARGITRAILDTFPVIKFSRPTEGQGAEGNAEPKPLGMDEESGIYGRGGSGSGTTLEMGEMRNGTPAPAETSAAGATAEAGVMEMAVGAGAGAIAGRRRGSGSSRSVRSGDRAREGVEGERGDVEGDARGGPSRASHDAQSSSYHSVPSSPSLSSSPSTTVTPRPPRTIDVPSESPDGANTNANNNAPLVPASIGRETCPICIVDFEEGDDLRVLPCEGQHAFHQQCVDPWLLELSSSCPICRHDFHALEEMIAGSDSTANPSNPDASSSQDPPSASSTSNNAANGGAGANRTSAASRFSRYLRFAKNRGGGGRGQGGRQWGNRDNTTEDPTDPPYPLAREHE